MSRLVEIGYVAHRCHRCGRDNVIVNQCRCDPDNLPTPVPESHAEAGEPFWGPRAEPPPDLHDGTPDGPGQGVDGWTGIMPH